MFSSLLHQCLAYTLHSTNNDQVNVKQNITKEVSEVSSIFVQSFALTVLLSWFHRHWHAMNDLFPLLCTGLCLECSTFRQPQVSPVSFPSDVYSHVTFSMIPILTVPFKIASLPLFLSVLFFCSIYDSPTVYVFEQFVMFMICFCPPPPITEMEGLSVLLRSHSSMWHEVGRHFLTCLLNSLIISMHWGSQFRNK